MKGVFIVFEGCDGTGKTTQAKRLVESGILGRSKYIRFPDRESPIGKMCDEYLRKVAQVDDHAIHLMFTANRWEKANEIKDALNSGVSIVCDRYSYSGAVYTASKGIPLSWCLAPEEGLPEPDLVIFIDIDPEKLVGRKGFGNEIYETVEKQKRVRALYHNLITPKWATINGDQSIEAIASDIASTIAEKLGRRA